MARREQRIEADHGGASYPVSGVSAYSRESARAGGSPYAPHIRAQQVAARVLIPVTIRKLREMESRMASGSPTFCGRMRPTFEEKKRFLARLIKEANAQ